MRLAILTSAHSGRGELFRVLAGDEQFRSRGEGKLLLEALATQLGAANQDAELADFVMGIENVPADETALRRALVASVMARLPAKARGQITGSPTTATLLKELIATSITAARDDQKTLSARLAAVSRLGLADFDQVKSTFVELLQARQPEALQRAALETLARFEEPATASPVIAAWPGFSPRVRAAAAEMLFARPTWTRSFVDAVADGKIKTADVDPARLRLLQLSADPKIRQQVEKLQGSPLSERKEVVTAYQKALDLKGDANNGKEIFKKSCSACHCIEDVGEQVGADLTGIKGRGVDFILLNILDPNREVLPQFLTYVVRTNTGTEMTGMITAETATSITLRRLDGTTVAILRIDIDELRSTGMSFMPEGLEQQISLQEMADLLAYLLATT
jgi:putative heme-binding domain-containing protein